MLGYVRVKLGVRFDVIAPAGFRLLEAISRTARWMQHDLEITCACEAHAATDPHSLGEGYDLRTHDLPSDEKQALLRRLMMELSDGSEDLPMAVGIGLATCRFYGQIEHLSEPNEHLHVQRRRNTQYEVTSAI